MQFPFLQAVYGHTCGCLCCALVSPGANEGPSVAPLQAHRLGRPRGSSHYWLCVPRGACPRSSCCRWKNSVLSNQDTRSQYSLPLIGPQGGRHALEKASTRIGRRPGNTPGSSWPSGLSPALVTDWRQCSNGVCHSRPEARPPTRVFS